MLPQPACPQGPSIPRHPRLGSLRRGPCLCLRLLLALALGGCGDTEEPFNPGPCQSELVGQWQHSATQVNEAPFIAGLQLLGQVPVCQDVYQGPVVNEQKFSEKFTASCSFKQTGTLDVGFGANISSACLQLVAQQEANPITCALLPTALASFLGAATPPGTCQASADACNCTFFSAQLGPASGSFSVDDRELTLEPQADAGDAGTEDPEPIPFTIKGDEMTWEMPYGETRFKRK